MGGGEGGSDGREGQMGGREGGSDDREGQMGGRVRWKGANPKSERCSD